MLLAKNASSNVSAVLFDLWERNRVELATRQSVLEIQILEDEAYNRMVEGILNSSQYSVANDFKVINQKRARQFCRYQLEAEI